MHPCFLYRKVHRLNKKQRTHSMRKQCFIETTSNTPHNPLLLISRPEFAQKVNIERLAHSMVNITSVTPYLLTNDNSLQSTTDPVKALIASLLTFLGAIVMAFHSSSTEFFFSVNRHLFLQDLPWIFNGSDVWSTRRPNHQILSLMPIFLNYAVIYLAACMTMNRIIVVL